MISSQGMRSVLVIVLALAFARVADAGAVGVVVTGEPAMQATVRGMVESWLKEHGHALASQPLDEDAQKTLLNCFVVEDLICARGVVEKRARADSLVFARVELGARKKGRQLTLTAYWFRHEHDPVVDKRACAPCGDASLHAAIAGLMQALADNSGLTKGRIKLDSKPTGLVAVLDGVKVGVTPLERDLDAGAHQVEILRDGASAGARAVTVEPDRTFELVIDTRPPEPVVAKPKEVVVTRTVTKTVTVHQKSRVLPALMIGGGVAAGAVGGVLLYYGHKGGPNDPYIYPKATNEGLGFAIGGGALLIAGVLVAALGGSSSSTPTAALAPGGGTVGWAVKF
jgi:hypothetical protein